MLTPCVTSEEPSRPDHLFPTIMTQGSLVTPATPATLYYTKGSEEIASETALTMKKLKPVSSNSHDSHRLPVQFLGELYKAPSGRDLFPLILQISSVVSGVLL